MAYIYKGAAWSLNGRDYVFGDTLPLNKQQAEQFARNGHPIWDGDRPLFSSVPTSDLAASGVLVIDGDKLVSAPSVAPAKAASAPASTKPD